MFRDVKSFRFDFMKGVVTCIIENGVSEYFWNLDNMGIVDFIVGVQIDNIEEAKEHALRMIDNGYLFNSVVFEIKSKINDPNFVSKGSYISVLDDLDID